MGTILVIAMLLPECNRWAIEEGLLERGNLGPGGSSAEC